MSDAVVSWRERAAELHAAELVALDVALERLADLEQLFAHRGDAGAREQLRTLAAFLRSKAGDVRAELEALELEALEAGWEEQSY